MREIPGGENQTNSLPKFNDHRCSCKTKTDESTLTASSIFNEITLPKLPKFGVDPPSPRHEPSLNSWRSAGPSLSLA